MERKCGDCALKALKNGMCPVFNADMEGHSGCPYFTTEITRCNICGNIILTDSYLQEEDGVFHVICRNCVTGHPCRTCKEVNQCWFRTDETCQEPAYVTVQQRQGNMVVQTQIQNPKRVEATCAQGCPCYNAEHGCMREYGCGCQNLTFNWRNN